MKLYYCPKTRGTRPRWLLEEMGLKYELAYINLKEGEHRKPDYLKINPMGGIPALEDGGVTLFESAAIVMYLADKYGQGKFAPEITSPERGSYCQWMFFSMTSLDIPIVQYFYHTQLYPEAKRISQSASEGKANFEKAAKVLTPQLENHAFILGNYFSAADVMIGSNLIFAKALGLLEDYPTLKKYVEKNVTSRPAFQRANAD